MIPKKIASRHRASEEPDGFEETLRARGLRLTRPRRLILGVVRASDTHPTAAFVYQRVRRRLPRISLATVYRNLRVLAAQGLLVERADAFGMRFEGNTEPHDHFTCVACRRIYDVPSVGKGAVRKRVASTTGFEVLDHRIEFYGHCVVCRERGRSPRKRKRRNTHDGKKSEGH